MTGAALVVQGDALRLPLPDGSVDLVVTSPPYWALRSYSAGPGEIGSEPTPQAFLEALWAATAEMARVLKPSGSMFVDLGDKYSTGNSGQSALAQHPAHSRGGMEPHKVASASVPGFPPKSLLLLPERYRVGCVDRLGLIARAVIVWDKPNGLPESVTDRVRRSHEDWVHLTRQPRYYSAIDEVRESHAQKSIYQQKVVRENPNGHLARRASAHEDRAQSGMAASLRDLNPLGALPGSVWSVPSEPLRLPEHLGVQHYAAFPSEWPRRLILGWSPPGICLDCGAGRVPVVEKRRETYYGNGQHCSGAQQVKDGAAEVGWKHDEKWDITATILGYACSCTPYTDHPGSGESSGEGYSRPGEGVNAGGYPLFGAGNRHNDLRNRPKVGPWREYHLDGWKAPPTRPAIILDLFGGTGTTAMVARALGRIGVSVDLSFPYCRAARWRVRHDGAKAISRTNLERQGSLL